MRGDKIINVYPELIKEWDFELNNKRFEDMTCGSKYKADWICGERKHKYKMMIDNKINKGQGCPYCSGRRVSVDTCLATTHPELIKDWDFDKNILTPYDISQGSAKKVFWGCDKNHSYLSAINSRTNMDSGCPYCAGKKATPKNNLLICFPEICKNWDYELNKKSPEEYLLYSNQSVSWICDDKKHKYSAIISNKTLKNQGCPYCAKTNKKVCADNCLASIRPDLLKEWDYELNTISPTEIVPHSTMPINWICENKHKWIISPHNREYSKCPYCANKKICNDNCLATVAPHLIEEWHQIKNLPLTPYDVSSGSNKKIYWQCKECSFEWLAPINRRVCSGSGCPKCGKNISYAEDYWLNSLNINIRQHCLQINKKLYKVDGFDQLTNTVYEFDGDFWHGNPIYYNKNDHNRVSKRTYGELYENTLNKKKILEGAGYNVISVWASQYYKHILDSDIDISERIYKLAKIETQNLNKLKNKNKEEVCQANV